MQSGNVSYGFSQEVEDRRLIRLGWYVEYPQFSFTNARGINATHALNVTTKTQIAESHNSVTFQGTQGPARVTVKFTTQDAKIQVRLESEIGRLKNYFEAVCYFPEDFQREFPKN